MDTLSKINDAFEFMKNVKAAAQEALQEQLEAGEVFPVLNEHVRSDSTDADFVNMSDMEKDIVIRLKETGRMHGGDQGAYADGVLEITFKNKQAAADYMDVLEDDDDVVGYEVEASFENLPAGLDNAAEVDFDDVMFDGHYEFDVIVYIRPDVVQYEPVEVEITDINGDGLSDQEVDETAIMTEIKRRIKVNFRGRRRVKMQCLAGFKYNPDSKVCEKITGADIAKNRISHRRAVRTRRAKGNGFKVRVARKTRKAKRFRKSMGLHEAVHPDTQAAWNDHFKKKDAQEIANQTRREHEAEAAKKKGSQSNKAKS